jgi:cytoskeletal protein RodZ
MNLNLEAIRRAEGITLEEIHDSTRIAIRFLLAIEASDYEKLPGGVYSVNYLRQYAHAIGLDELVLLAWYRSQIQSELPAPPAEVRPSGWLRMHESLRNRLRHFGAHENRRHA